MPNNENNRIPRDIARVFIKNNAIPSHAIKYLQNSLEFYADYLISYNLGIIISNNNSNNSMKRNIEELAKAYLIYSSTLDDRMQMLEYIDAAIILNPKCTFPNGVSIGIMANSIKGIGNGLLISSEGGIISYILPEEDKGKLVGILNTRKGKILRN